MELMEMINQDRIVSATMTVYQNIQQVTSLKPITATKFLISALAGEGFTVMDAADRLDLGEWRIVRDTEVSYYQLRNFEVVYDYTKVNGLVVMRWA